MADPITIGAAAATAGGAIVSGIGQLTAGAASAATSKYKAGVALLNKQINQQNASWALEEGDIKGEEAGLKAGQEIGQTKAVQAASGLDVNSGSNAAVRDTQQKVASFDQNVIAWDAAKTSYGFETKAMTDTAEANLDVMAAGTEQTAGTIGAIGSFLGGASSVASKWKQAQSVGLASSS
jgi:hypothetical protein